MRPYTVPSLAPYEPALQKLLISCRGIRYKFVSWIFIEKVTIDIKFFPFRIIRRKVTKTYAALSNILLEVSFDSNWQDVRMRVHFLFYRYL